MMQRNHLKRKPDLFADMPPEIIIQILSKLPVPSIISCKCVCKSWLALVESHEFVKSYLLKSIPGLAVYNLDSKLYKFYDFEDGVELEHHGLHYKPVTKFNVPAPKGWVIGSANGLLFLCHMSKRHALHICNPITRDYIDLDCHEFVQSRFDVVTYGFGSSKISGQHKAVRIFQKYARFVPGGPPRHAVPNSEYACHVYTVGTGLWRRISAATHLVYCRDTNGTFLNGNLHWPVSDFEGHQLRISCFDLETERFSTFSSPLDKSSLFAGPSTLGDCLCLCDNSHIRGIDIWLMKEYGIEESWTKLLFIADARPLEPVFLCESDSDFVIWPIKIFKDGDILLAWEREFLFYSKKNNTVQKLEMFEPHDYIEAFIYNPSFLSLKSFEMEKVISF